MKKFVLHNEDPKARGTQYAIAYREVLNEAQCEAVMHDRGAALVVAGAGTGKTRTLVYRVARLVEDGTPPESILLLTFTRRAAREMLERASGLLDERCSRVKGGTFHFYCNQLLHRYAERIGYPANFTLLDQADAMDAIHHIRAAFVRTSGVRRFPGKKAIQAMISTAINKKQTLHDVLSDEYPQFLEHHDLLDEISGRYKRFKEENGVMDFDDLLVLTRRLLLQEEDVRNQVAAGNRHVMVDEYQDTNALQAELVRLFGSYHHNIMAVGDDAQSIYAFRGADHKNILSFPSEHTNCRIIKLEENYRSVKPILDLSNALLDKTKEKYSKNLYTDRTDGDLPGLVRAPNERDQSRFVAQMLLRLREQEVPLNEIAVLFRNGRDSYDLEWELNKNNIPFRKFGGQKFAEAAHIRDVLGHLRVIVNPGDQIAWSRILTLLEGIGPKTADELILWLQMNKNRELHETEIVSKGYREQLERLSGVLAAIRSMESTPSKAVEAVVEYYMPICKKKFDDYPKRQKDLEAFGNLCSNFRSFRQLLQELTLDPIEATAVDTERKSRDELPLTLSTIHSAKGLEWDTVFIIQCLDGIIPSGYSVENVSALDEELRLLYVACTRARERLFVTYPVTQNGTYGDFFSNPSRFLSNVPENVLEPWYLEEAPPQKQLSDATQSGSGEV
ncbi:ATP-dependent helicase [Balneolales bacterium ANBcel1]|nr:ATP-dependent helicase [Balneolales bacterium ANBcel1]